MLFGRAAAAAPEDPGARAPAVWTGKEPGLTGAEQELLRGYREELALLIRQLSFALTRRLPGVAAGLDPRVDSQARAQALSQEELAGRRLAATELSERDQWLPGAARLLRALEHELELPKEAVDLLRQAQRLAPHPMNLQHQAFWLERLCAYDEARQAAVAGLRLCRDPLWQASLSLILGRIDFASGRYLSAARWYDEANQREPSSALALSAWHCAQRAGDATSVERLAQEAQELSPDRLATARQFRALTRAVGVDLRFTPGFGPASDRWIAAFAEVV
jgi:tetratricopeptide (TPR) repeat protein